MSDFTVDIEREADGRWLREVPELPGVLAYASSRHEAVAKAKALAFRVKRRTGSHRILSAADPDGNLFRVFFDFATPERERARPAASYEGGARYPGGASWMS
ncbi:MAG TPA: type II toxin-antitoxin system HicB family antitoxin [Gemmatimonadaceae bacterium]